VRPTLHLINEIDVCLFRLSVSSCLMTDISSFCYILSLTFALTFIPHARQALQGEILDPEDAFEMLTSMLQVAFRPVYGDADVLTLKSFDGFEITKQVRVLWCCAVTEHGVL
jgi:hypothetical protein